MPATLIGMPPSLAETEVELPVETPAEQLEKAGAEFRRKGKGLRLRFRRLGGKRKVRESLLERMLSNMDVDHDQVDVSKRLYDAQHPAIKGLTRAFGLVEREFKHKTLPYPAEHGVRIYMPLSITPVGAAKEETLKIYAEELEGFLVSMRAMIEDEVVTAVERVSQEWPSVLEAAKKLLRDTFDESEYPQPEDLPDLVGCHVEPFNLRLPDEYKYMSAEEKQLRMEEIDRHFQAAAQKQEAFVVKLISEALEGMLQSVGDFRNRKSRSFKDTRVERVFGALKEFREKTVKYGILRGTALESEFNRLNDLLKGGDGSGTGFLSDDELPEFLRQREGDNGVAADELLSNLQEAGKSLAQLLKGKRRHIVRPQAQSDD